MRTYIHPLTGLRGLAALIVFISHCANKELLPAVFGNGYGQVGVMLFFVLSGFLMTYLYGFREFSSEHLSTYFLARAGRVLPLYFVLLVLSIGITFAFGESFYPYRFESPGVILKSLLLVQAPYVFWTIPVEVQFYLLFVGVWYLNSKGVGKWLIAGFGVVTMLPGIIYFLFARSLLVMVSSYSYAFFIGVFTALYYDRIKDSPIMQKTGRYLGLPALLLLFVNLPALRDSSGLTIGSNFFRTWGDPFTWLIIYVLFLAALLNSASVKVLNHPVLVYFGKLSYGFYLIHYPVIMFFIKKTDLSTAVQVLLAFGVTVALSHLSFYYFEEPVRKRIRGIAQ